LKKICEIFIEGVSVDYFGSIKDLTKTMQTFLKMDTSNSNTKSLLKIQPFAKPEKLHDIFAENYKDVRRKLPITHQAMSLYLSNKDIEAIILKRIKVETNFNFNFNLSKT
jgi:hypothetical protein